jgi:hypothetical protein
VLSELAQVFPIGAAPVSGADDRSTQGFGCFRSIGAAPVSGADDRTIACVMASAGIGAALVWGADARLGDLRSGAEIIEAASVGGLKLH